MGSFYLLAMGGSIGRVPLHFGHSAQLQKSPFLVPLTSDIGELQKGQVMDGSGSPRKGTLDAVPSVFSGNARPQPQVQIQRPSRDDQRLDRGQASEG